MPSQAKYNNTLKASIETLRNSKELFLDTLLRGVPTSGDSILTIDLSRADWLSDFQLTCLPFVLAEIRKKLNKAQINLTYYLETLFEEDSFFDYLTASGFFDFVADTVDIKSSRPIRSVHLSDDPLLNFQAFRNLVGADGGDDESQRILFELSSTLKILSELLSKEIFGKTDVGNKIARVIAKELIENINQHSRATKALVRLRIENDYNIVNRQYGNTTLLNNYLRRHREHSFLLLTVSDNGMGIVQTIKEKYDRGYFVPNATENLSEMMNRTTGWWIKRAFETHFVKDTSMRVRLGLKAIRDTVIDYEGALYVRTADAGYLLTKDPEESAYEAGSYQNPYISGTHYLVMLPAKERKKHSLEKVKIYSEQGITTFAALQNYRLETFDIAMHYRQTPVTSNVIANETYVVKTVDGIIKAVDSVATSPTTILEIDFSNGVNYKAQDYIHILASVDRALADKFTSRTILRNVSDELITAIMGSPFAQALQDSARFLVAFDKLDKALLIGCKKGESLKELHNILQGQQYTSLQLSPLTKKYVENNNVLMFFANLEGSERVVALQLDNIFRMTFSKDVASEVARSQSLITGHFQVSSGYHVDKYLIAHSMFKNPNICRKYAKEIAKLLDGATPSLLLSYSTSGVILYWYLRYHYFPNLGLSIASGPSDVDYEYGIKPSPRHKLLVVTDVMLTGRFMGELRRYLEKCNCTPEAVLLEVAIFKLGNIKAEDADHIVILHELADVSVHSANDCHKDNGGFICSSVASPESRSRLPTAYEQQQSRTDTLRYKRGLLDKMDTNISLSHRQQRPSQIDDETMSEFELLTYWRAIQGAFQMGHVERAHTHFDIYDIPERLLFKRRTAVQIENYVKKFAWSFKEFIHFVVFPSHLTAAYLAHMLATKFINKPIVAEVRHLPNGSVILPESLRLKLGPSKNVVIVDDASNTGTTLKQIIGLLLLFGVNIAGVFTLTSRIQPENEAIFRRVTSKIASAYRLNLGVYPSGSCPNCDRFEQLRSRMKEAATPEYISHLAREIDKVTVRPYEK